MRHVLSLALLAVIASACRAHPGVGIVADSRGNIYYTDLKQVWKIDSQGRKSVAVPGVHTHELCLDSGGNLFGEHLWYEGERTGKWGHRVWRLAPDGALRDVIPAREGFLSNYSFVRDASGAMYWAQSGSSQAVMKRAPGGKVTVHSRGPFVAVRWMAARADGTLYLIDNGDLKSVSPSGSVRTIVRKLSSKSPPPAGVTSNHYHMGLWPGPDGGVYIAIAAERVVVRVSEQGAVTVVDRGEGEWTTSGGTFDRRGNLWLLDYSSRDPNRYRARKLAKNG
jgi:hypothetical protein